MNTGPNALPELEKMLFVSSEKMRFDNVDDIKQIIEAGVDIYAQNAHGTTAMHFAAIHGNAELVSLFLCAGCPINQVVNGKKQTMLHAAMDAAVHHLNENEEIIKLLVASGADLELQDGYGKKPADYLKYFHSTHDQKALTAIQAGLSEKNNPITMAYDCLKNRPKKTQSLQVLPSQEEKIINKIISW